MLPHCQIFAALMPAFFLLITSCHDIPPGFLQFSFEAGVFADDMLPFRPPASAEIFRFIARRLRHYASADFFACHCRYDISPPFLLSFFLFFISSFQLSPFSPLFTTDTFVDTPLFSPFHISLHTLIFRVISSPRCQMPPLLAFATLR